MPATFALAIAGLTCFSPAFCSLLGCRPAENSLMSYESKSQLFVRLLYFCSGRKFIEFPAIANAYRKLL
jgi:hypothetical protein